MREPSVHWLRENHQERAPWRVLTVDTETRPASELDPDRQVLRLWAARLDRRRNVDPRKPRRERFTGTTAAQLVDLIESLARADHALWVAFHNLSFDLAVTALPVALIERGWRLTEGALTTDSPWCRMARRSHHLAIVDSWSFIPTGVDTLGELRGKRKLPLPAWSDPDRTWLARCVRDVEITADALLSAMDWWDQGRLGNWSITGPSTGWSSFRHRRPAPHVLVDPDPAARELEARAITGGRRQVWRTGQLEPGLFVDLDMPTAHLAAMAGLPLPMRRFPGFESLDLGDHMLQSEAFGVLAECELETMVPRYPWRTPDGVFYPVGRFHTVLAGPELREALRRGELRSIGRGYRYQLYPHMRDWALWVASLLDPAQTDAPPAVRIMAKSWSRSVPGKWAGHTSEVLRKDPDPRPGWLVEPGWLPDRRAKADLLTIGGQRWTILRDRWSDDAFPAVLAWIQSAVRVALGRLVDELGPAAVSCNTDGVLVDVGQLLGDQVGPAVARSRNLTERLAAVDWWAAELGSSLEPFGVRVKHAYSAVRVISPQHLVLDRERRLSGIPRRATSLVGGRYSFTAWPKLRVQLSEARAPSYVTRDMTVDLSHVPPLGWLLDDGRVIPAQVQPGPDGQDALLPWDPDARGEWTLAPDERQHPRLARLIRRARKAA